MINDFPAFCKKKLGVHGNRLATGMATLMGGSASRRGSRLNGASVEHLTGRRPAFWRHFTQDGDPATSPFAAACSKSPPLAARVAIQQALQAC